MYDGQDVIGQASVFNIIFLCVSVLCVNICSDIYCVHILQELEQVKRLVELFRIKECFYYLMHNAL